MCLVVMFGNQPVQHRFANGEEMAKWCFQHRPDLMRGVTND